MKLSTRMIIGWVVVFAGAITLAFDGSPWFFLGAILLSDLLRTQFEPHVPRDVDRRRRWIFLPPMVLYLGLCYLLDVPDSPTHPFNIIGAVGLVAGVAWLIRDDVRVYRQLHEHTKAA